MSTEVIRVSGADPDSVIMRKAAGIIRNGGLVAFPTETVYGLGADAFNRDAFEGIFRVKSRPMDNPLILHIAGVEALDELAAEIPDAARACAEAFWPGPLTLVVKKSGSVPDWTAAGLDTVAVRMPSGLIARRLIELSGKVIAAPSANSSGKPSPTNARRVYEDLNGKIPLILDGGTCEFGVESTVLDVTKVSAGDAPVILRPGAVTIEMLRSVCGRSVRYFSGDSPERPSSPGMKYKHYAPT
ncbi:MAG: L-threonylcarbamoyladenylate synthase, partial [Defluviitaleaceae bacterium]|nr:L-threonylcarbamoyladenylate synthase [Defluviitaleaceae bacterium]